MIKFTAFRTRKPRQFNYIPRFYDPEKEAREERRRELLGEDSTGDIPEGEYKPGQYIRRDIARRRGMVSGRKKQKNYSVKPVRLVLVLILLGMAVWWVLH